MAIGADLGCHQMRKQPLLGSTIFGTTAIAPWLFLLNLKLVEFVKIWIGPSQETHQQLSIHVSSLVGAFGM
jgi:hypothetical protein